MEAFASDLRSFPRKKRKHVFLMFPGRVSFQQSRRPSPWGVSLRPDTAGYHKTTLVNVEIKRWRISFFFSTGKSTISMAMFNSYS